MFILSRKYWKRKRRQQQRLHQHQNWLLMSARRKKLKKGKRSHHKNADCMVKNNKNYAHKSGIWKVLNNLGEKCSLTTSLIQTLKMHICESILNFKKNCESWIKNLCLISIEKLHSLAIRRERVRQKNFDVWILEFTRIENQLAMPISHRSMCSFSSYWHYHFSLVFICQQQKILWRWKRQKVKIDFLFVRILRELMFQLYFLSKMQFFSILHIVIRR